MIWAQFGQFSAPFEKMNDFDIRGAHIFVRWDNFKHYLVFLCLTCWVITCKKLFGL